MKVGIMKGDTGCLKKEQRPGGITNNKPKEGILGIKRIKAKGAQNSTWVWKLSKELNWPDIRVGK